MRKINLSPNELQQLLEQAITDLMSGKKSITLSINSLTQLPTPQPPDKAEIRFSQEAYAKMQTLVNMADGELAWHGLVNKISDKEYYIYDILVYPQRATKTTVESDDDLYPLWLEELEDEQFNAIRMQGHSHVNMGTSPSGTDEDFYETLMRHINDFYIFIIMNKSSKVWVNLYDIANNLVYEPSDIVLTKEGPDYTKWYRETYDEMVDEAVQYAYYHGKQQKKAKSSPPSYAKEQKELRERYNHYMAGGRY